MRFRCPSSLHLWPLFSFPFFLTLNLKALTNRKTFPTVNKHVNKSTRDAPDSRFIFKVPRRRGYLYRRFLFLLSFFPLSLSLLPFISNAPFTYTSARPCTTLKNQRATIYVVCRGPYYSQKFIRTYVYATVQFSVSNGKTRFRGYGPFEKFIPLRGFKFTN